MKVKIALSARTLKEATAPKPKVARPSLYVGKNVAVMVSNNKWFAGKIAKLDKISGNRVVFNNGTQSQLLKDYELRPILKKGKRGSYTNESVQEILVTPGITVKPKFEIPLFKQGKKINNLTGKTYLGVAGKKARPATDTEPAREARVAVPADPKVTAFIAKYKPLVDQNQGAIFSETSLLREAEPEKDIPSCEKLTIYYLTYEEIWKLGDRNRLSIHNLGKKGQYVRVPSTEECKLTEHDLSIHMVYGDTKYTDGKDHWD